MFGHLPELLIIMVVGLIVFGPDKLPEMTRTIGKAVREVRQAVDTSMRPEETEPDDFTSYYYESLARSGETVPTEAELEPSGSEADRNNLGATPHQEKSVSEASAARNGAAGPEGSATINPPDHPVEPV